MSKVIPAILTKDIAELQNKLVKIQGLTDWVQIDIMDGEFVGNTSISLEDIFKAQAAKDFSLEAHLMVKNPADYFSLCQKNNVKRVIFHIETGDTEKILSEAQKFSFQKGLALNPETPIQEIMPYINQIDVAVLMSVEPGFGGQEFIIETLQKISELKKIAPQLLIEIDGGVNLENIKMISDAGADYLVVGSGLFKSGNIQERFKEFQTKIASK